MSVLPILVMALLYFPALAQPARENPKSLADAAAAGDWERTRVLARVAVRASRRDVVAWTYLGLAAEHLEDGAEALKDFGQAARISPDLTYTHNNYGASLEANGRRREAEEEYRRSLALDRDQPAALVNLARLLIQSGEVAGREEAQGLLRSAWVLAPDAEIARSLLVIAPCASGMKPASSTGEELAAYAHVVERGAVSVPSADRDRVGLALLKCGSAESALLYYDGWLGANPADPQAIVGKAQAEMALGRPADAGRTLEGAVAGGMTSATVYGALAQVYQRTGHMDHAVDAMRRALEVAPDDDGLQFRYGMLLLDAHAPKAAELRMKQAVERNKRSARLWFVLGLSQFDETDPATAQGSFDRSIALDAEFVPALAYRGIAALDQQRYAEAEGWYRHALRVDDAAADLHCLLAEALEREHPGELKGVREELLRALALDPKLATAHLSLGRLDLGDARAAEAAEELESALRLDPKQRQAHFYLARAYRQLHQPDRAAAEAKLFSEEEAAAQVADRTALQESIRQFAHTAF